MYQSGQQQQPQPMISTNALEGALLLQNQASMQAQMASQMRQIQELQESLTEAKAELEEKEKAAKHQAELHQSFLRALQSKVSSSGSSGSQQASDEPNSGKTSDKATEKGGPNSTADYTELLAGFEEVAAAPAAASGGATDLADSPLVQRRYSAKSRHARDSYPHQQILRRLPSLSRSGHPFDAQPRQGRSECSAEQWQWW